jgi:hypothetical protein
MKAVVIPAILAVVLAGAGAAFWTIGKSEQRLADAHKELVMLRYADASAESDAVAAAPPVVQRVSGLGKSDLVDARHVKSTADYWQSAYAALEPKRDAGGSIAETDPEVLLLAANASFRASQNESDRNLALRKLDAVVKNYAEVLKNSASDSDAAYNYEYSIRLRDALVKARPAAPGKAAAAPKMAANESDLPAGPTLHGHPGGPPAKTDMAQFKIVIPKRGEERKDDPQAGKGGTKVRKG